MTTEMVLLILAMLLFCISLATTLSSAREKKRSRPGIKKVNQFLDHDPNPETRADRLDCTPSMVRRSFTYNNRVENRSHQSDFTLDIYI